MSDEAAGAPSDAPAQSETISIPVATFIEDVGKHLEGASQHNEMHIVSSRNLLHKAAEVHSMHETNARPAQQ